MSRRTTKAYCRMVTAFMPLDLSTVVSGIGIRSSLKTRLIKGKADRYGSCKKAFQMSAAELQVRLMNCLIFHMGCKKQNKSVIMILRLYYGTCNTLKFMV